MMTEEIKQFLREAMERVKAEFAMIGMTPRQFAHLGGDQEYAEIELLEVAECDGIDTEAMDYDDLRGNALFQKAVRWQAAYNRDA